MHTSFSGSHEFEFKLVSSNLNKFTLLKLHGIRNNFSYLACISFRWIIVSGNQSSSITFTTSADTHKFTKTAKKHHKTTELFILASSFLTFINHHQKAVNEWMTDYLAANKKPKIIPLRLFYLISRLIRV